ncbi:highly divergent homeobox [Echeneis naucrates]|uniref:Homeobox domain-containing protein n=1 Tax=Echeneis naucrates TaxID=173247 RepID=A0A665WIB9_ECHNA|nr:highly divergent homeobox [Echeneis naucrates]XP_029368296.1 highly divergent homeobox [Echeneis naucrates]XP_029368297.1 highly divergent homeobox [Echeneis naucrates]
MAAPFPSSSRMDAWPQRRGLQTMNLRSVFTAEQQRILERYYENGMTNQSKACFQLILQCAQEAKLDFSVVRTWVGNKRRKLASKIDQNGGVSHSLPSHGLAGGLVSNHVLAGGALSNHSLSAGALLPAEIAAARNIQNRVQLLPPSSSFPSFSSASSSPSSSSPLSSGSNNNNNNNDVILTGIYSLNSVPRSRSRPTAPPSQSDSELSAHMSSSLINQVLQSRNSSSSSPFHSKLVSHSQNHPSLTSASGPLVNTAVRKGTSSLMETGISAGAGVVPHSWTRQYGTAQTRPWSSSSQSQLQPRPHSNPQPQPPPPQKTRVSIPVQNSGPTSEQTPRIQQVFTLSEKADGDRLRPGPPSSQKKLESLRQVPHPLDTSHNFSIAMETGDEAEEWQREEELANMAAQTHIHKQQTSASPNGAEMSVVRGNHTPPVTSSRHTLLHSNTTLQGSYSLTAQTSLTGESSSQTSVSVSAAPWVISNSRKRTLQDRTQFSDGDLIQLKRYWDRGMTSLGSVCREKITSAANQLNVDTEIVKTWISNRRRKYRLMGIEIPPPKGGPAVFPTSSPGNESPVGLSPGEERLRTPELGDDLNDGGSLCLSEDGTEDSHHRDGEDGTDVSIVAPMANDVKIEVIGEDEEDDDDDDDDDDGGELVASDLEQMQNLLEFKHEEVQFLENELENQKQKYLELASFTRSLLIAVRNNDLDRQQELMASLPQPSDPDWDTTVERGSQHAAESADTSSNHNNSPVAGASSVEPLPASANNEVPLVSISDDSSTTEVTEPSASEEQEAVLEQK